MYSGSSMAWVSATVVLAAPLPIGVPASAQVAPPIVVGTWKGLFLGYNFTFEFNHDAGAWTGRYRSDKGNKWADIKDIVVTGDTLRFSIVSQPPSVFTLKIDGSGKTLIGSAQIKPLPMQPLTLTRAS
jgi:hypothetical protein